MSALSNLLVEANREHLSARALAREARERGYSLNHDTAARYLRGDHGTPDEATLLALSEILQIPLRQLRLAAELPHELTDPYTPPAESSRLSRRQRKAVDEIIRAMLDTSAPRTSPAKPGAKLTGLPAANDAARRAARHGEPEPPPGT